MLVGCSVTRQLDLSWGLQRSLLHTYLLTLLKPGLCQAPALCVMAEQHVYMSSTAALPQKIAFFNKELVSFLQATKYFLAVAQHVLPDIPGIPSSQEESQAARSYSVT